VATLLAWNAILSTLIFYEDMAPSYSISFILTACYFSFYVVVSVLIIPLGYRITYFKRVHANVALQAVIMFFMPYILTKLSSQGNEDAIITVIVIFFMLSGILVSCLYASTSGFCSSLAPRNITLYSSGIAAAGLSTNLIRAILLMIYPEDDLG